MSNVHVTVFSVSSLLFIQKKMQFNPVFSQKKWEGSKVARETRALDLLSKETEMHFCTGRLRVMRFWEGTS